MKKTLLSATILCSLLFAGLSANAATTQKNDKMPPPPPPGEHKMHKPLTDAQKAEMEKRKAEMDKRLGITEEQKAQLKAIHEKSKKEIAPKIKKLSEDEYELEIIKRKEFNKANFGINTFENAKLSGKSQAQLESEIKTLRNEIREIKKANFEESQKVFTDKQKEELAKMQKEHMKKHKAMKKHPHGHGGPGMPPPPPPRD